MTPVRRAQRGARAAISDAVWFRTYDEMIEEKDEIAFPNDLEFRFQRRSKRLRFRIEMMMGSGLMLLYLLKVFFFICIQ